MMLANWGTVGHGNDDDIAQIPTDHEAQAAPHVKLGISALDALHLS